MAGLNASVSFGCNVDGTGWLSVLSVSSSTAESIEVTFTHPGGTFKGNFPPDSTPFLISPVPVGVTYAATVFGSVSGAGSVSVNEAAAVPSADIVLNCFACDIAIASVQTAFAQVDTADGTAIINATGANGAKQYSINGLDWQSSNAFNGLTIGEYMAYVRYTAQPNCTDLQAFSITAPPVFGCTNPAAKNYDPEATEDDGQCIFDSLYYPTGGTLPNAVFFERQFSQFVRPTGGGELVAKARHYVTVNIYRPGEMVPFATKYGRVRNGLAKVDVSRELQIGMLDLSIGRGLVSQDNYALFPFEFGYIESYNGTDRAEQRENMPKRYAVRAATPEVDENLYPYIVETEKEALPRFLTAFETPVKFHGEPFTLSIIIDEGVATHNLNLERSYFDTQNRLVQRNTTPIAETGFVRFEINDDILPCAAYMEVVLIDEVRTQEGICLDPLAPVTPPTTGDGEVTIKDGAGNVLATVPAGGVFVIESGFSFGFRIL